MAQKGWAVKQPMIPGNLLNRKQVCLPPPSGSQSAFPCGASSWCIFKGRHMSSLQRISRKLTSVRTGMVLLILVGISSAAGTLILQRPLSDPEQLRRAYSPQTLRWLDGLGLTDVFHSWWFASLAALLGINLVLASVERFPLAWRYFSRPYRRPEPHFMAHLTVRQEIPLRGAQSGIEAAERAFRNMRLKPQRVGTGGEVSLYSERHRAARLAAYVVHASLLLIFAGAIVGSLRRVRGFVTLVRGQQTDQIELRNGAAKTLPFAIRCDGAGQENYPDGTPRRWWSRLALIEQGKEVKRKEIEVNDPLVHRGFRFFQSSYGLSGQAQLVKLTATPKASPAKSTEIALRPDQKIPLDEETSVRLAAFVPDLVVTSNGVETRSGQPNNPAIQLCVESKKHGESKVWLFPRFPDFSHPGQAPYTFQLLELQLANFTGLQVAYEPGQWAVWAGCVLLAAGLAMSFYMVHMRFWAVPVSDGRGRTVLWVGASASKNRDQFQERFQRLVAEIQKELGAEFPENSFPALLQTAHAGTRGA